jgi:hypothetical protein
VNLKFVFGEYFETDKEIDFGGSSKFDTLFRSMIMRQETRVSDHGEVGDRNKNDAANNGSDDSL